ncbi:NAD-dependent epimerase/dehydratase [[Synechococcus] sp. NIES-970]|uniref:GDP-mannose 4,6-dehydratase n=1 Tax=Picosynechococcus sp. NKBG15041c TaxID=1407650 RepID=UPI0004086AA0|nr:GDP-mannose 4,6-dehydratase [Picosynechococcus sp. NKBG15041c]BAW96817.1 NAD-dependent epimerase/dehydratase [[Synechococcus] sp. NIES-970]
MSKKALICGISGQDGAYLAKLLINKNYEVYGTSRDAQMSSLKNLEYLGIRDKVQCFSMSLTDFRSVLQVLDQVQADEVYNLAGQSSVGLSFDQPVETLESITIGTLNLLESIRFIGKLTKLYNAGSSECFGDTHGLPADEQTPFRPRSPYAVAKSAAFWEVANYREAYNLFCCSGILFNHESPLRPQRFVTQKIIAAACRIANGSKEKLMLGNINIERDWGYAPDYVEAMYLMLQQDMPGDFVIATGKTISLSDFISEAFSAVGLHWQDHVVSDASLCRPTDISVSRANPSKAREKLGWVASRNIQETIKIMVAAMQQKISLN